MQSDLMQTRADGQFLHPEKLRWLLWLRWRLFMRGLTRNARSAIGFLVSLLFILLVFGGASIGSFVAYRLLPAPANFEVLALVLTAMFIWWIILPLMQYNLNEGLDVSKLIQFPLTRWEIMAGLLSSTVLDVFTLALLLMCVAVIAGFTTSVLTGLLTVLAMLIFYVLLIGSSQLVLAFLSRVLQSRRFRDLSYILIVLFASSCYLFQQLVLRGIDSGAFVQNLLHRQYSIYLQWLPPVWIARAIEAALSGNWLVSAGWLLLALLLGLVVLYLWQLIIQRALTAPEVTTRLRAPAPPRRRAAVAPVAVLSPASRPASGSGEELAAAEGAGGTSWGARLISPQVLAITVKEFKYFRRDPQMQALLFQSIIFMVAILILPVLSVGRSSGQRGEDLTWLLFYTPAIVLLYMLSLSLNTLGMERNALTTLFLFPVKPQRILFGKNLAIFALGLVELLVLLGMATFVTHAWNLLLPVLVAALAGMGIVLGAGNVVSIFFPQRMRQVRGMMAGGAGAYSGSGCIRALVQLLMMLVTLILLLPVGLALGIPALLGLTWLWIIFIPLSLAYGLLFYQIATRLAAPHMLKRAPEILEITTRE
jgi:ABC-2 type transport system permease protein